MLQDWWFDDKPNISYSNSICPRSSSLLYQFPIRWVMLLHSLFPCDVTDFYNENRRQVTADVNTALVDAECETRDANHRRETNCVMHLLPNCIWLRVKVNWHFRIAHPGTMNVTPTAFPLRGQRWEMKMNACYFTVGLLRSTDNHNSLLQKLNKSLHHGVFSDTALFLLKTCFWKPLPPFR